MTIRQLHIGLDLGLQQLNSNLFNRLEEEDKDFIINDAIDLFLNSFIEQLPIISNFSNDDRNYYSEIFTLVKDYDLPIKRNVDHTICYLPNSNDVNDDNLIAINDNLVSGVSYKLVEIVSGGLNVDLSAYGGEVNSSVGTIFKCDLGYADVHPTYLDVDLPKGDYIIDSPAIPLTSSNYYKALYYSEGGMLVNSNPEASFNKLNTELVDDVILAPLDDIGMYYPLYVVANVEDGYPQYGTSDIEKGEYYKLYTDTTVNLSSIGGLTYAVDGTVFEATVNSSITLTGNSYLVECKNIPVMLYGNNNSYMLTDNSYGSDSYFLNGEMVNNSIKINGNGKIINFAKLTYISKPASVNVEHSVNCDLPSKTHRKILNFAIQENITQYTAKNAAATGQMPQNK